jgi:hypothetical protein
MKFFKKISLLFAFALVLSANSIELKAQTEVSTGADLYSTYVWRGVAYSGPSLQPYVEVATGGFTVGAWGSQGYDGFQEMDLYAGYSLDNGLSLGVTGYYYPGSPWLDFGNSHALEINLGFEVDAFSIAANLIPLEATGAGAIGGDMYFEAGYAFDDATSFFVGGGNGWHTNGTTDLGLVNLGISTGKEIVVTDTFSIPVSGSVILNPYTENLYIVVGFSF